MLNLGPKLSHKVAFNGDHSEIVAANYVKRESEKERERARAVGRRIKKTGIGLLKNFCLFRLSLTCSRKRLKVFQMR